MCSFTLELCLNYLLFNGCNTILRIRHEHITKIVALLLVIFEKPLVLFILFITSIANWIARMILSLVYLFLVLVSVFGGEKREKVRLDFSELRSEREAHATSSKPQLLSAIECELLFTWILNGKIVESTSSQGCCSSINAFQFNRLLLWESLRKRQKSAPNFIHKKQQLPE